ncbi:MAG: hypothetical protein ACK55Z_26720, partial [bacterium]
LAQLVPHRSSSISPGMSMGMFSICEHFATRAHLLSSVLSYFHISISSVSSRSESQALALESIAPTRSSYQYPATVPHP